MKAHDANAFEKPFSVLLFGSHPDKENDDCWTGADFATEAEARACLADPWKTFNEAYHSRDTEFFVLDGVGLKDLVIVANPGFRARKRGPDREWQREIAMQAGMGLGVEAYNDEMGY